MHTGNQWHTQNICEVGRAKQWGTRDLAKEGVQPGVWGRSSQPPEAKGSGGVAFSRQQIFAVFTLKTLILAHVLIEKGHAVSVVTIDNAKIFLQLMFKNRSLAKTSKRRLQSLLVCEIID